MYCIKCGKELPDQSAFCAYCGENLTTAQNSIGDESMEQQVPAVRRKVPVRVIGIISCIVMLVGFFGVPAIINATRSVPPIAPYNSAPPDGSSSPDKNAANITAAQIKRDLVENEVYIVTAWWEDLYHLNFDKFEFDSLEITKTLSEDKIIYFYVNISGKNNYNKRINAPFIVTYKKFNEGWAFTSIKYNGSI